MDEIHERLGTELKALGLTAAQAARDAGLPDSQGLRDVLAGRKRLSAELLAVLTARCGLNAVYVLTGQRTGNAPTFSAEEQTLVNYFRAAPKDVQRTVMGALLGLTQMSGTNTVTVSAPVSGGVAGRDINHAPKPRTSPTTGRTKK